MIDVIEILTHWYAGRSQNELATSLGVDRKTLRKYTAPAVAAGMAPGGSPMDEADWRRLATEWFPQLTDHRLRQVSWPGIEPHRDYIAAQLKAGVTVATIHQRLRDEHGLTASVASVRRWVRATLPEQARRAQVTVLGDAPPPGEQAQIDYGRLGMWLDPATGRRRAVWAFVMVLACSRHLFVRPTLVMDQAEWTAAHVEAFAFFGGVPARLVPDNLKTGVDKPDLYDPKINRSYAELAAHYDTLVDPARAAKPKDKPQVERPMPYVRDSFWRGREFGSLAGMRADALRWSREVAGTRACRPLDGAAPAAVFAAVEASALRPLPVAPFVLATWSAARVGPDIHARVGGTLYSLPWRFLGDRVDARSTPSMVQFFHHGQLIKTHPRKDRGKQTDLGDYPPEKSGSPGALLRRGPLRTARAAFTASSSSKPRDGPGLQCCAPASAGLVLALAGGVRKAGGVLARRTRPSVMDEVVSDYRLPGDLQPPAFPFVGRLRWLIGGEQLVPAEGAAAVLPGEQTQRVAIQRGFDASPPSGPVLGQGGVVRRRPTGDRGVPDDVGPGKLDQVSAAGRVAEHPVVVPELVELPEVAGANPRVRFVGVAVGGPLVGERPQVVVQGFERSGRHRAPVVGRPPPNDGSERGKDRRRIGSAQCAHLGAEPFPDSLNRRHRWFDQ